MKKFKRIFSCLVALVICLSCMSMIGCKKDALSLSETSLKMGLFESKTLTLVTESDSVVWSSTNSEVLNVEGNGKTCMINAVGTGSASVTATVGANTVKCDVTVLPTEETLSLELSSAETLLLTVGESSDIIAKVTFKGEEFGNTDITYEMVTESPKGCVSVDENGKITAVSKGSATVKVKASFKGVFTNDRTVTVHSIPLVDVQLNTQSISLFSDSRYPNTAEISAKFNADGVIVDATVNQAVSADESVAVFENGVIKAVGVGQTTIKLTYVYQDGLSFDRIVSVTVKDVPKVKVYLANGEVTVGNVSLSNGDNVIYSNTVSLAVDSVTVDGLTVNNPAITWSVKSGDEQKISVSANGVVTGKLNGTATVIATYIDEYGAPTNAECTVNVSGPVYYGKHTAFNHNGIVAEIGEVENSAKVSSVKFSNVSVPSASASDQQLIHFQYVPSATTLADNSLSEGPRNLEITIQDANDADKYFTVAVIRTSNTSTRSGVRTSAMGDYYNKYYGYSKTDGKPGSSALISGSSNGWAVSGLAFSFLGEYLDTTVAGYENNMMGISVSGTVVYLHVGGEKTKLWDMNADTSYYATTQGGLTTDMAWETFNPSAVNIYVRGSSMYGSTALDPTTFIVVDTLGGVKVTENNANEYIAKSSYIVTGYNGSASTAGGKPVVAI